MSNPAGLALEGNDPRDPAHPAFRSNEPVETQLLHGSHDPSVTFEEYMYYAAITRAEEKVANEQHVAALGPRSFKSVLKNRFSKGPVTRIESPSDHGSATEKSGLDGQTVTPGHQNLGGISEAEWKNASRAVRTAGWSSVFYLITTDILGPFSVPYVPTRPHNNNLANL